VVGGLLLVSALALTSYNIWDGRRADAEAQNVVEQLDQMIPESPETSAGESLLIGKANEGEDVPSMATIEIDGNEYIGELKVPDLNLTLPVMADWDDEKLKLSPCRYAGSYYTNDLVIAGHNYARHFSSLKWLPEGSRILFRTVTGEEFAYVIKRTETLQPEEIEKMVSEETGTWDLTLFTCTTGGQSRCTIRCVRE
jgi:sortase A